MITCEHKNKCVKDYDNQLGRVQTAFYKLYVLAKRLYNCQNGSFSEFEDVKERYADYIKFVDRQMDILFKEAENEV